jgi:hypothetical protein
MRTVLAFADTKAKAGDFGKALQGLNSLEKLLQAASGTSTAATKTATDQPGPADGMPADAALEAAAQSWEGARLKSLAELDKLAKYILADFKDEPDIEKISKKSTTFARSLKTSISAREAS